MPKRGLGITVEQAARERIHWAFGRFDRLYVSFSGGKDSTVMLHLVMDEAIARGRKVGVLFVDLEGQYRLTIDHIRMCLDRYRDHIEPHWVALPIHLRNAVSQFQPHWVCWDPAAREDWIRPLPPESIHDPDFYPFFRSGMEFEEFVPEFGLWYARRQMAACFVGIRADESLNRWRTVAAGRKQMLDGRPWTTWVDEGLYNVYPIYDWRTRDVWIYHARFPDRPHNALYDRMHQAGLTIHQMRICQPYGDDQRKGLWLFQVIEPETWSRVVARVNGANQGALYAQESGNILGRIKINKPPGHTWESFAKLLLESMPPRTRDHYENKIATFLHWYHVRGWLTIPDDGPVERNNPNWKRICKALLRNDYWCKGLSFSQQNSNTEVYLRYARMMRRRREQWGLFAKQ